MKRFDLGDSVLINSDNMEVLKSLPDNSIDSVVTDPPYGISFMGKKWDYDIPKVEFWQEVLRVLKPGAHGLVACGTRTQHRMAVNLEDAGFEIRDVIMWVYDSGFPKSLNIGKAVDKLQGNEWEGYGTALKPAVELFTLVRKPISEKNIAENVLRWGTGGINIDGCRVETDDKIIFNRQENKISASGWNDVNRNPYKQNNFGRFPANLIHDGSEEVVGLFPETKPSKVLKVTVNKKSYQNREIINPGGWKEVNQIPKDYGFNDNGGSAARFFYCAKASARERNEGLDGLELKNTGIYAQDEWSKNNMGWTPDKFCELVANFHPTVKPIALMQYLCRLITPKGGTVLDPFAGSGTTGIAAINLKVNYILIEREADYCTIADRRLKHFYNKQQPELFEAVNAI